MLSSGVGRAEGQRNYIEHVARVDGGIGKQAHSHIERMKSLLDGLAARASRRSALAWRAADQGEAVGGTDSVKVHHF